MSFCLLKTAKAQVYNLQSIDGIKVQVRLYYKPSIGSLAIVCAKDTLYLADYMDLDEVKVLGSNFLQVSYAKRAGSNEEQINTMLLCVCSNKLIQAMHIKSFFEYDMRNIYHIKGSLSEYHLFKAKIQLIGNNKTTYKLKLDIHDENNSERNPKVNYNSNKQRILDFDFKQKIFYNSYKNVVKSFRINDLKTQHQITQNVNSFVSIINISNTSYYYINNQWYEKAYNDYLIQSSFK